jgi:putative ABC transport system substrate-binding protein
MFCIAVLFILLLATALSAEAQQTKRVPRIGFISPASSPTAAPNLEALRQGLRESGYIEGKSIVIEARWAEGAAERFPQFLAELNQLKVDVIVIGGAAVQSQRKNPGFRSLPYLQRWRTRWVTASSKV